MIVRISSNLSELMSGMSSKANETTNREELENWAESVQLKDQERIIADYSQYLVMFDLPDDRCNVTHELGK